MKLKKISFLHRLTAATVLMAFSANVLALPTGFTVQSGNATISVNGSQFTINAGNNAQLNWSTFNLANGESAIFNQPSSSSIVWNRVNDPHPSQIYGSIQANGVVVLLNSSGFYFGPNSFVSAAGLVVSTANCVPPQNAGGSWEFNGPPPLASIVNFGTIKIGNNGSAFLIADKVENYGNVEAPGGTVGFAAGQTVTLSERPDGRGMSMNVTLPKGSVNNYGNIIADSGVVALNAKVVNQDGLIQANSVRNQNGVIELVASDELNLGADSKLIAHGDDSANSSAGGKITLKSENTFSDANGSLLSTRGSSAGGSGGDVEVSALNFLSLNSAMDASAQAGFIAGEFLLDPVNIILGTSGTGTVPNSGTVSSGGSGTLSLNVNTAFLNKNFSNIKLQATGNITLNASTTWNLSDSTGVGSGQLTLQAGGNVIFNNNSFITDNGGWSVSILAGVSFPSGVVQAGVGNIFLNSGQGKTLNGAIQLASGNINLVAGNNIQVGSGYVRTIGGGSISAMALAGSINTGTDAAGYRFLSASSATDPFYLVDQNLGGISTAAGGNVTLNAGLDVVSYLPSGNKPAGDAGSGAFGSAAGNVTVIAGRNVTGHYVVANGTGSIMAGNDAGNGSAQLALSLIKGGWSVNAVDNIYLQEVRNPNGALNSLGGKTSVSRHFFDYAPGDSVSLTAGNGIELSGASLPRNSGSFETALPEIFPGILNMVAGAGGITLDRDVMLFPSAQGSLQITTTAGGNFSGTSASGLTALTMSDSADTQYLTTSAFTGHAPIPLHLHNPTPVTLNISGNLNNVLLSANEAAQINVRGNMVNSRFSGQNLFATDATRITVAGDILNRNEFTDVLLATAPDLSLLGQAYPPNDSYASLASQLHYDPTTKKLTFVGRMNSDQLAALTQLTIQLVDAEGLPRVDADGNPVLATVSILDTATATALYNATQDIPFNPGTGYFVGGGGEFDFTARNMDLGATLGIQSIGPVNNTAVANYFNHGANINVNLTGNLDMFSTTISSQNGGTVNVRAGGNVNVGSTTFSGNDLIARGIFTVARSDVSVIANGDINVNGSRIAAYDGGNVTVESLHGNINAGTGGQGSVSVNEVFVDPLTHQVLTYTPTIPGSGILATTFPAAGDDTFPASRNLVGNILVEAPNGNINANQGGVVQLPLNQVDSPNAVVQVLAGYELRDSGGNAVNAANLASGTAVKVSENRNIDASGSGVIGSTVKLKSTGSIIGVIFARNNIDITAQQNVSVTALAQGTVSASAGGSVSGTLIGVGGVSASGGNIDASLISNNGISGSTSGQKGTVAGTAADSTASAASAGNDDSKSKNSGSATEAEDATKKKGIALAQKVSRVTVFLPTLRKISETTTKEPKS